MNEFLKKQKPLIVVVCVALIAVLLGVHTVIANRILSADNEADLVPTSNVNPRVTEIMQRGSEAVRVDTSARAEQTVSSSTPETKPATTAAPAASSAATAAASSAAAAATTAAPSSRAVQTTTRDISQNDIPFATSAAPDTPADYSKQWNLGYLIAVDNPDETYSCAKVTLTDEDRDLLERLCYGEFGTGGFIGASLIAQCVKDAMCFDGYTSVEEVIRECRYDGSTDIGTNDECRQAVRYIFDENQDAVQHRLLYMYNPYMVQSAFHESQNFILSYASVRFFDRWGI